MTWWPMIRYQRERVIKPPSYVCVISTPDLQYDLQTAALYSWCNYGEQLLA